MTDLPPLPGALENALAEYWDAAYFEGEHQASRGDANARLHAVRVQVRAYALQCTAPLRECLAPLRERITELEAELARRLKRYARLAEKLFDAEQRAERAEAELARLREKPAGGPEFVATHRHKVTGNEYIIESACDVRNEHGRWRSDGVIYSNAEGERFVRTVENFDASFEPIAPAPKEST